MLNDFSRDTLMMGMLKRSVMVYFITEIAGTVLPIMFSYYIYKKKPLYRLFRTVLFIPTIISGIITITIFKTITERMIPSLYELLTGKFMYGLLSNPHTTFDTVLFYTIWMSFGSGMLIQLAAMNTVDESVTEAAKLDGIGFLQEFWYIILPASYMVLSINLIAGFAGLFTNNLGLYAFYGLEADSRLWTLGYYFTVNTINATTAQYPYYSAWGLITSTIAIPVTLTLRHVIYKYGPSEE